VQVPATEAILTAEWLEYELHGPGVAPRSIRRELFDVIGPAARAAAQQAGTCPRPTVRDFDRLSRALGLLGVTEILVLPCDVSPFFLYHLETSTISENRPLLARLIETAGSGNLPALFDALTRLRRIPRRLYGLAFASREWYRHRNETYVDRPRILSSHTYVDSGTSQRLSPRFAFDIVYNYIAVHPAAQIDPFSARVESGVIDTNTEALLMSGRDLNSPADLFAAADLADLPIRAITRSGASSLIRSPAAADAIARINAHLQANAVVITTEREIGRGDPASLVWWRVDPETGETLGIGDRGWGQTATEYVSMISIGIGATVGLYVFCEMFWGCADDPQLGLYSKKRQAACAVCSAIGGVAAGVGAYAGASAVGTQVYFWLNPAVLRPMPSSSLLSKEAWDTMKGLAVWLLCDQLVKNLK
jgi:hypothetical protein